MIIIGFIFIVILALILSLYGLCVLLAAIKFGSVYKSDYVMPVILLAAGVALGVYAFNNSPFQVTMVSAGPEVQQAVVGPTLQT